MPTGAGSRIRWRADFDKLVLTANCARRGWEQWEPEDGDDWDVYWASVHSARALFSPESGIKLNEHQRVNHFPNQQELTRKDLMAKNLRRYRKSLEREGKDASCLDFVPMTYTLPADLPLFTEEYKRCPNSTWIVKPSGRSQGKGIFLVNKLSQVKRWLNSSSSSNSVSSAGPCQASASATAVSSSSSSGVPYTANSNGNIESFVVSRYIEKPLLIGGRKFDLRLYVLVTSYRPLKAYMSIEGFARLCSDRYDNSGADLDNRMVHLTNASVQRHNESYNTSHGNKWPLDSLRLYLESTRGKSETDKLFARIRELVVVSLRACSGVIVQDRHCFELYGFDVMIDDSLKPWLIEVNSSPSLSTSTAADRSLKMKVIADALEIAVPERGNAQTANGTKGATPRNSMLGGRPSSARRAADGKRSRSNSFEVIVDDEESASPVTCDTTLDPGGRTSKGRSLRPPSRPSSAPSSAWK